LPMQCAAQSTLRCRMKDGLMVVSIDSKTQFLSKTGVRFSPAPELKNPNGFAVGIFLF